MTQKHYFGRLFAFWWHRYYEKVTHRVFGQIKTSMFAKLKGTVVEIGPGAGLNLRYYPKTVRRYIGIEPSIFMMKYFQRVASHSKINARMMRGNSENIPLKSNSTDTVISTHVLCSVNDVQKSLQEIVRVLKPGGTFLFIEHEAAPPGSLLRKIQNFIHPIWFLLGDGCHTNRRLGDFVKRAGFSKLKMNSKRYPKFGRVVSPHVIGTATK